MPALAIVLCIAALLWIFMFVPLMLRNKKDSEKEFMFDLMQSLWNEQQTAEKATAVKKAKDVTADAC
jgi:hypothetical protein